MKICLALSLLLLMACQPTTKDNLAPEKPVEKKETETDSTEIRLSRKVLILVKDTPISVESFFKATKDENNKPMLDNAMELIKLYDPTTKTTDYTSVRAKDGKILVADSISREKWESLFKYAKFEEKTTTTITRKVDLKDLFSAFRLENLLAIEKCHMEDEAKVLKDFIDNNNSIELSSKLFSSFDKHFNSFRLNLVFSSENKLTERLLFSNFRGELEDLEDGKIYVGSSQIDNLISGNPSLTARILIPFKNWCRHMYRDILDYDPVGNTLSYPYIEDVERQIKEKAWVRTYLSRVEQENLVSLTYPLMETIEEAQTRLKQNQIKIEKYRNKLFKEKINE